jgi:hypothetical protein
VELQGLVFGRVDLAGVHLPQRSSNLFSLFGASEHRRARLPPSKPGQGL